MLGVHAVAALRRYGTGFGGRQRVKVTSKSRCLCALFHNKHGCTRPVSTTFGDELQQAWEKPGFEDAFAFYALHALLDADADSPELHGANNELDAAARALSLKGMERAFKASARPESLTQRMMIDISVCTRKADTSRPARSLRCACFEPTASWTTSLHRVCSTKRPASAAPASSGSCWMPARRGA